ncbi:hypothetical protein KEM55_001044 [Ascosphaera atra]|nr:hypothetical protein KEM55_001044 [Ascosphaera atra]
MLREKMRLRDFYGVLVAVAGTVVVVLSSNSREQKLGPDKLWGMIANSVFAIYSLVTCTMIAVLMWVSETCGANYILVDVGLVGLFVVTALMQIRYINRALQRFDSTQVIPTQFVMFTLSVIVGSAIVYRDFECATWKSGAHFICGCTLTFFGVYLITSGRPKNDDELKTDEEALPSYPAISHAPIPNDDSRSLLSHPTVRGEALSPIRSIIDTEDPIDHDDDGSLTPRATSPLQPMSEVSSLLISETTAPSSRLHSRTRVPIDEERPANTAEAGPTPAPTSGEILLRFPSAPGMAEEPQRGRSPQRPEAGTEDTAQAVSRPRVSRTGSRAWARSLPAPTYFAFVPYLAPLSGGITMALADTLSRNDTEANNRRRNSAVPATEYARLRRTSCSRDRGGRPRGRTMGSSRSHVDIEAQVDQNEQHSEERSRKRGDKFMGNPPRLHSRMRGYTE